MSISAGEQTLPRQLRVFGRSLTGRDRASLGGMLGTIVLLHVIGFGLLFGLVVPHHYQLGNSGLFGASSVCSPTPSVCGMRSTPTTSPRWTTRPASCSPTTQ
jgi:hypothetical protein